MDLLQAAATADMTTGEIGEVRFILFVTIASHALFFCVPAHLDCAGSDPYMQCGSSLF